jgi:hypothetical protein
MPSALLLEEILIPAQGNVTLSLSTAAAGVVGNATLNDLTLRPGDNSIPLTAIVDEGSILKSRNSSGFVTLEILGTSAVFNGEHLTYYVSSPDTNNKLKLISN